MLLKFVMVMLLVLIICSLGSALFFMFHDKTPSTRMVKALTWRVGLSVVVFTIIMIGYYLGWIAPNTFSF